MENEYLMDVLVARIKNMEARKKSIANFLRNQKIISSSLVESGDIKKVSKFPLTTTVAGVDSSTRCKSFSGIDIFFSKVIGVVYFIENDKLKKVEYVTNNPLIEYSIIAQQLSEIDLEIFLNILRQKKEISMAMKVLEKFEPEFLVLNGSILPHYIEFVSKNYILQKQREELIEVYKNLYKVVKEKNTILVGVVEDSRGRKFTEIISENLGKDHNYLEILEESRDVTILDYTLEKFERTPLFYYSEDLPELDYREFQSFYIKVSEFDIPLRVDFYSYRENLVDKISNLLLSLKTSEEYGMPSILIEADLRSKFAEEEIDNFCKNLMKKVGFISSLKEKRREKRPF